MNVVSIAPLAFVLNPLLAPATKQHHWHVIPGTNSPVLVLSVAEFAAEADEKVWVGRQAVISFGELMTLQTLPQGIVDALASLGAQTGDTGLMFLARLRASWPMARPWFY